MLSLLSPPADVQMAASMRSALVVAWWLLPLALALCAWFLHRQRDRKGVKAVAWFAVVIVAGFGVIAGRFLLGAWYSPHGNASLSVALTSTIGCVLTPNSPDLRYYCPWPSLQFVLLPAIYLLLGGAVARRSWRNRDRTTDTISSLTSTLSRNISNYAVRLLWPAIPIAIAWFNLRYSDGDPLKGVLALLGLLFLLAAVLLLVALFARWFSLWPSLIGASLLLPLSIFLLLGGLMAGFAPHGSGISKTDFMRIATLALAAAYLAMVLLGFATSAMLKIRDKATPERQKVSQ